MRDFSVRLKDKVHPAFETSMIDEILAPLEELHLKEKYVNKQPRLFRNKELLWDAYQQATVCDQDQIKCVLNRAMAHSCMGLYGGDEAEDEPEDEHEDEHEDGPGDEPEDKLPEDMGGQGEQGDLNQAKLSGSGGGDFSESSHQGGPPGEEEEEENKEDFRRGAGYIIPPKDDGPVEEEDEDEVIIEEVHVDDEGT